MSLNIASIDKGKNLLGGNLSRAQSIVREGNGSYYILNDSSTLQA